MYTYEQRILAVNLYQKYGRILCSQWAFIWAYMESKIQNGNNTGTSLFHSKVRTILHTSAKGCGLSDYPSHIETGTSRMIFLSP